MGIRVTAQRLAVTDVLAGSRDHLTAQEVYQRVQERFPHITMGTVYNTLDTLVRCGFVHPLPFPHGTRYDANVAPHVNLVCTSCGAIADDESSQEMLETVTGDVARRNGFQVTSHRFDFYGLCATCADKGAARMAEPAS